MGMNNSREKGSNPKPVKKHRDGFTGERRIKMKEFAIKKAEKNKSKSFNKYRA